MRDSPYFHCCLLTLWKVQICMPKGVIYILGRLNSSHKWVNILADAIVISSIYIASPALHILDVQSALWQ